MDVVPMEYGMFSWTLKLTMRFFQFITGNNFRRDYVLGGGVCSAGVDWYLIQIEYLYGASRQNKVVLLRSWFTVTIIHDDVDATVL